MAANAYSLSGLDELQREIADWRQYNFPTHTAWEQLLGVLEELGEIAHVELKFQQGIRGHGSHDYKHNDLLRDGIGDLLVFLMGYAEKKGWTLSECLIRAWDEVKQRDWQKYPETGLPPKKMRANL